MIKLIATDMDGTLLNAAHEITPENQALLNLRKNTVLQSLSQQDVPFTKRIRPLLKQI